MILPASAMDFPDGAMRFNWCNCQTEGKALGLGSTLFDFGFWNDQLGYTPPPPAPVAAGSFSLPWALIAGGAAMAALLLFNKTPSGGGRRSR